MKTNLGLVPCRAYLPWLTQTTALLLSTLVASGFPIITNIIETGGDNEATDTVTAKWTGVTFSNGVAGEFLDPFTVGVFGEDVPAMVDRVHQWNGATDTVVLPPYLVGGEYIMSGNDNRDNASYRLDVTLAEAALVYVLVDNRLADADGSTPPDFSTGSMGWLLSEGWTPVLNGFNRNNDATVPDEVGVDEGADGVGPGMGINQWSSVYVKTLPAGTFSLLQADNGGQNMYGVVVTRLPGSTNSPPEITGLNPTNNTLFASATAGFQFTATTVAPNEIDTTNITVLLNGVNVSANLAVTGNATRRNVAFNALVPDTLYHALITVTDRAGRTGTASVDFDTFSATSSVTVEAEDYNYERGRFLDPVTLNGYANLIGTPGIDYRDFNVTTPTTLYRPNDFVGIATGTDVPRQNIVSGGATDFQVGQLLGGEWLNYTRNFNNNTYHVYLRSASGVNQRVRLDRVTGDRTASNQTVFVVGTFDVPAAAYGYVPLADGAGKLVALSLSGVTTLRLTPVGANLDLQLNYMLLVPASGAARPVYISEASPGANETRVSPDAAVRITIANGATAVAPASVRLNFNGTDVTAAAVVSNSTDGLRISYDPPGFLVSNTVYTVALSFADAAGTTSTNNWSFTTVPFINIIPPAYSTPPGSGQGSGFRTKIRKAPNADSFGTAFTLANTAQRAEQQLADQIIDPETTLPYVNEGAGPNGNGLSTNLVLNFQQAGTDAGYFPGDSPFPFLDPNVNNDPNNIAMEATAYLELTAGRHRLGIRSDDGFKLTTGPLITDTNLVLAIFEGGRGDGLPTGASEFDLLIETNGVYPVRLIWYEGNGGASLEFYSVDPVSFTRTLVNDPNTPGSVKAFLARPSLVFVPTVSITSPTNETLFPSFPTNITVTADAAVVNGRITKVEFFTARTNKIGEATSAPFTITWANVRAGRYSVTAKATDANNLSTVSAPVQVIVGRPLITSVVEIGGDDEATDTVAAKWTGVTFSNGIAGEFFDPFTVPPFGEDVPAMVDRAHQWNGAAPNRPLPAYLVGGEYIMSGNDNRDNSPYQLDVTLSEPALVYVLVDNRLSDANGATPPDFSAGNMSWLLEGGWTAVTNGWNRTGTNAVPDEVGVDEAGDGVGPGAAINQWSSVYVKQLPAGTFSLFQADNAGQNMYGVVITRIPVVTQERPRFTSITRNGAAITLTWVEGGRLEEATDVTGPWSNVAGNPQGTYTVSPSEPRKFYRVARP